MNGREILREIIKSGADTGALVLPCKVDAVDGAFCDVTPVDDSIAPLKKVRLNAAETGLVITPEIDSIVLVVMISETDAFVGMFSDIEKITLNVEDSIEINGGANGGLTITPKLVQELNKNNQILQAIMQTINSTPPINEPGNGSPSAFQAALKGALTGKQLGDFSQIENEKIKH